MKKIFKFIYDLLSSKFFRFALAVVILITMFILFFNKKYINKEQTNEIITAIKNKEVKKFIDNKKLENKINEEETIKKEIKPEDSEVIKIVKNENSIFSLTSKIDAIYKKRLEKKQISYNKKIKNGDYVYYYIELDFGKENNKLLDEKSGFYFFAIADDRYYTTKQFLNKKVGDKIILSFEDNLKDIQNKDKELVTQEFNAKYDQLDEILKNNDVVVDESVLKPKQIITILDIIPNTYIKKLNLETYN